MCTVDPCILIMKVILISLLSISFTLSTNFDFSEYSVGSLNEFGSVDSFEGFVGGNTHIAELYADLGSSSDQSILSSDLPSLVPSFYDEKKSTWALKQTRNWDLIDSEPLYVFKETSGMQESLNSIDTQLFWDLVKEKRFIEAVNAQKHNFLCVHSSRNLVSVSNVKEILASESPESLEIIDFLYDNYMTVFFMNSNCNDKTKPLLIYASHFLINYLVERYPDNISLMSKIFLASLFKPDIKLEESFFYYTDTRRYHWFMDAIRENLSTIKANELIESFKLNFLSKAPSVCFYMNHGLSPFTEAIESSDFDAIEIILSRADAVDVVIFPYSNFCSSNFNSIGIFFDNNHININARNRILKIFLNIIDKYYKSGQYIIVKIFLNSYIDNLSSKSRWAVPLIRKKIASLMNIHMGKHHFTTVSRLFISTLKQLYVKLTDRIK